MAPKSLLSTLRARVERLLERASTVSGITELLNTRWYLLLRTLPKLLVALLLRAVAELLGLEIFSAEIVAGFANSAIFVVAILMSGVLEDYKESESLPSSLASDVEGMSEQVELCVLLSAAEWESCNGSSSSSDGASAAAPPAAPLHGPSLHAECLQMLEAIFSFLASLSDDRAVLSAISSHSRLVAVRLTRAGFSDQAGAVMEYAQALRSTVNRMFVIKRTDFLESGTALMELLMYLTIGLTIAAKADSQVEGYSGVAFTTLQFFYVLELLRDIDDPFEYDARKLLPIVTEGRVSMPGAGVSAEVDLFPIMNCYARISQRAGRVVGKADRSQDLVVVQGTGEVVRRPHLQQQQRQQRQQPASEEKKQKGGEGGEGEEEEEEKLLEEEEITEQHFVGELRAAMGKAWAEVDGVEDVSGAGDIGSSSSGSGSGSGSAASRSSVPLEVEEEEEEGEEGEEEEGEEEEGAVSHEEREQQQQQQQASGEGASLDEALPWHPEARLALAAATRGGAAWSQSWSTDSSALRHRAPRQPQHAAAAAAAAAQPPPSLAVRTAPSALLPGAWPSLAAAPASSSPPAASPLSSQSSSEGWREGKRFAAHTSGAYRGGSVVR